MLSKDSGKEESFPDESRRADTGDHAHPQSVHRENIQAALALLLGPETDYVVRARATRRLTRQEPTILPILLATLSNYPEITTPAWPWSPPQYEHCSRLLAHFSQQTQIQLAHMLRHATTPQPAGPVLWVSIIEAIMLLPDEGLEALLREGLATRWITVRYAAAMALATRAKHASLDETTVNALRTHLGECEDLTIRLAAAYALLNAGKAYSLETLIQLMDARFPDEVRKAATFILATNFPLQLCPSQRTQLSSHLLCLLEDTNMDLALSAAHALSKIAPPSMLSLLSRMLDKHDPQIQIATLTALEEIAHKNPMKRIMRSQALPARIVPLLKAETREVRRQASYTLAACGGEYVMAVFGTLIHNRDYPGRIEAVEGLRLLSSVLRPAVRMHIVCWLLGLLSEPQEEIQITSLNSLAYILWQTRKRGPIQAWHNMSSELLSTGIIPHLLRNDSACIRQQALELIGLLQDKRPELHALYSSMVHILQTDSDSGVRACAAFVCGQIAAYWSRPALLQTLLDEDSAVAETAFHALCQLTTTHDAIFVYVVKELIHYSDPRSDQPHPLAQLAQEMLKKWYKTELRERRKRKKRLHSSS